MAETATWADNIGQIFLSDDSDSFWMFPRMLFYNKRCCMTSPWFTHANETWRLVKTPRTINGNYVSLFLWKKVRREIHKYVVQLKFKTLDNERETIRSVTGNTVSDYGFVCYDFCSLQDTQISFLSSCGLMKLFFTIQKKEAVDNPSAGIATSSSDEVSENDEESKKNDEAEPKGVDRLLQNMKSLMLDEQSSDVSLKIEGRVFKAHRAVLKQRSPVFASMFQPHTKECATGVVDIPDCSASAFEVFMLYIYTGSVNTITSDNVCDLYYTADKYQINDLKSECVEFMENNLSLENFYEYLCLCFQHNELGLEKTATRFFCDNIRAIIKTDEWQKLLKEYTAQANVFYIKAVNA